MFAQSKCFLSVPFFIFVGLLCYSKDVLIFLSPTEHHFSLLIVKECDDSVALNAASVFSFLVLQDVIDSVCWEMHMGQTKYSHFNLI